jgi:hypothetical protein
VLELQLGDEVGVDAGAEHAVHRAGQRASDQIADAESFERLDHHQRDSEGLGERHSTPGGGP